MGKYGKTAILAVSIMEQCMTLLPQNAWEKAVAQVYPDSLSSREKGCPKGAFLGLCEEGRIKFVSSGRYTQSKKNKAYALIALDLLKDDPTLATDQRKLWDRVQNGSGKQHNQQMDVVISLWENDFIK